MPLFLSTTINRLDKKGRVSVPSAFRAALADQAFQGVVLFASTKHACLEGFDYGTMTELAARMDHFDLFSDDQDDLATTIFGASVQCPFDGDGRIMVPDTLIHHASLTDEVAFVGLGHKFQIWQPAALNARRESAARMIKTKGLTLPRLGLKGAAS